jgi:hypothetical protein
MIPLGNFLLYVFLSIVALVLAFIFIKGFWKVFLGACIIFFGFGFRREIAEWVTNLAKIVSSWFKG